MSGRSCADCYRIIDEAPFLRDVTLSGCLGCPHDKRFQHGELEMVWRGIAEEERDKRCHLAAAFLRASRELVAARKVVQAARPLLGHRKMGGPRPLWRAATAAFAAVMTWPSIFARNTPSRRS